MWEVKGDLVLKGRKERKGGAIIALKEVILPEISLILPVGNVVRKGMRRNLVLSNFLEFLLYGIKELTNGV